MLQEAQEQSDAPVDEGVWCPQCDYNLTGLESRNCPECGAEFDLDALRQAASRDPQPVHPWDDRKSLGFAVAFRKTCAVTWFGPGEFARQFPARHGNTSAWVFSITCYVLVWLVPAIPIGLFRRSELNDWLIFMSVPLFLSAVFCESIVAIVASALLRPTVPRKLNFGDRYHFYRGLTHFTSSYLILSALVLTGATLTGWDESMAFWAFFLVLIWWWVGVALAIVARSHQSLRKFVFVLTVPLAAIVSVFVMTVGVMVAFAIGAQFL